MTVSAILSKYVFYQKNTNEVLLEGVQDKDTLAFWNVASMTGQLFDQNGNVVLGPFLMNYIANSNGNYEGIAGGATFDPPVGSGYVFEIDGDNAGVHLNIRRPAEVQAFSGQS